MIYFSTYRRIRIAVFYRQDLPHILSQMSILLQKTTHAVYTQFNIKPSGKMKIFHSNYV